MVLQNWFADAFMRPVFHGWLTSALTQGAIKFPSGSVLPIQKLDKFAAHAWLGRRWGWVDPLKDIEASRLAIKTGIASPQMVAAQAGVDVEDVIQAIAEFERLVAESGVKVVNFADTAAQQQAGQTPPENVPTE
jgi:capsid protein